MNETCPISRSQTCRNDCRSGLIMGNDGFENENAKIVGLGNDGFENEIMFSHLNV